MDAIVQSHELVLGDEPIEIKNLFHRHPFKLQKNHVQRHNYIQTCLLCRERCPKSYFCQACDFHLCPTCVNKSPLVVDPGKTHEHPLSFVPKFSFVFTCDACGVGDRRSSICMCIPCCFAIHLECVRLPRIICINRHDHRISLRLPLGSGDWTCRVCRKYVNGEYGAYSCLTCSSYVVHSKCATDYYVWDGIDLEGVPEEDPEEIMPFKVVEEGVIKHFGHEHNLRLAVLEEGESLHDRNKQCSACIGPIYSDPFYICTHHCDFILHEVCANFLKKKRHPADSHQFTLSTFQDEAFANSRVSSCICCQRSFNGFSYGSNYKSIDVLCATFQDEYVHVSHPHSGLVILRKSQSSICSNCKRDDRNSDKYFTMGCTVCDDFELCYCCLTLPKVVEHKYDKHPLSLCYGENSSGEYWCDICEKRLDPHKWYYTCREGNSTLHTCCVLGANSRYRIGYTLEERGIEFEVVSNNSVTRPHCHICSYRCQSPSLFKFKDLFFCSLKCIKSKWRCMVCRELVSGLYCPTCKEYTSLRGLGY